MSRESAFMRLTILAGVAAFTGTEFDDNTGLGKINAPRGLSG